MSIPDKSKRVVFDAEGFAVETAWATVYNINRNTLEFSSETENMITVGVGLPAGGYLDPPPGITEENKVVVRGESGWEIKSDFRGTLVYNKETKFSTIIHEIGEIPEEFTTKVPGDFDVWMDGGWKEDEESLLNSYKAINSKKKELLLSDATQQISILQDAIDLELSQEGDEDLLKKYRIYRIELNRVDVTTKPNSVIWPTLPK